MAKGARPKKEMTMKLDTKFRKKWYAEADLKEKLIDALMQRGLTIPEDEFGNDDIEGIIELAYENNITV